ncbi:hypothetical protein JL722_6017 [Aureococcus anophagefferens]|nr:hypothetical protein JL722_6017 [Aureococcus anophagefferens]
MGAAGGDARGKGPLAMSVLCIVVAVGQQVVQRTGFDWFKRTPLTFVNNYPNKRELFKIVDGGDGRKKKKILGILGGGGGTFQAHADDGMVFGWRRVTKTGSSGKAKEESVAVTKELRPTFVLGSEAPKPHDLANLSPDHALAVYRGEALLLELGPLENGTALATPGDFLDWKCQATGELHARSAVTYPGEPLRFEKTKTWELCRDETPPTPKRATGTGPRRRPPRVPRACKQLEGEAAKAGLKSATVLDGAARAAASRASAARSRRRSPGALSSRLVERAAAVGEKIVGREPGARRRSRSRRVRRVRRRLEYAAHADGAASGAYVAGGRVASVVHYCAAPSSGGATVFPNLDVKIDAVPKSALFFAYKGSDGPLGEATARRLPHQERHEEIACPGSGGVEKARPAPFYDRGSPSGRRAAR